MASKSKTKKRSFRRGNGGSGKGVSLAIIAGMMPGLVDTYNWYNVSRNVAEAGKHLVYDYLPYDPWTNKITTAGLATGLVPLMLGFVAHGLAERFGLNRMIRKYTGFPVGI